MSWSTSKLWVRLARSETGLSPSVKYFYWPFQGSTSFVDHLCYFCLVFVMLSCASVHWCPVITCRERVDFGSRLWCLIVKLSLPHWYPGSGVVLYIDFWSLPSFLLFSWEQASWRTRIRTSSSPFHHPSAPEKVRPRTTKLWFVAKTKRHRCLHLPTFEWTQRVNSTIEHILKPTANRSLFKLIISDQTLIKLISFCLCAF